MFGDAKGSCVGCNYESSTLNAVRGVNPCDQCFNYGLYKSSDKCRWCNGHGVLGGHSQDGSHDDVECHHCDGTGAAVFLLKNSP